MENIELKKFKMNCFNIDCTLIPDGSAYFVQIDGKFVGQKNKTVSIGIIENLRILECQYPEMQNVLSVLAEKIALN